MKSLFLLHEIYTQYLIEIGVPEENILLIELDDDKNAHLRNPLQLGTYVREFVKNKQDCYVILDEIQRVFTIVNPILTDGKIVLAKSKDSETISFVDVALGLSHEKNIDLYITGSNSKMLSTDIVTQFRDKASNIHISPLSFDEFYHYKGGSKTDVLYEYMQYGGMPLAVLKDENQKKEYLKSLFETTYFKDILEHNRLNKSETLDELCTILSDLTGELLNSEKLSKTYQSIKHENIGSQTIEKYIQYFKDAFILREAKRYDIRGKKEIGALRKYYFVDTGLRNARLNFAYPDEGQLLENIIYNELSITDILSILALLILSKKIKKANLSEKQMRLISLRQNTIENATFKFQQMYPTQKQKIEKFAHSLKLTTKSKKFLLSISLMEKSSMIKDIPLLELVNFY